MKYAFDMQGTLVSGDLKEPNTPIIELARALVAAGHEVYIVSAANEAARRDTSHVNVLRDLCARFAISNHGIFPAYFQHDPEEGRTARVGAAKTEVMRSIGADILFDDIPEIVEIVRAFDLIAIQVQGLHGKVSA